MSTVQPEEGRGNEAAREHRAASLTHWEEAASGWIARQAALRELSAPVSHWMIDAVDPQPGQRVLELAAGLGETGFLAAEMVAPVGGCHHQRSSRRDARRCAQAGGRAQPHERRVPSAQCGMDRPARRERRRGPLSLGLHADGRSAYRSARDPSGAASRRARGLAVWDAIEHNPWALLPGVELLERGLIDPPAPERLPGRLRSGTANG